MMRKHPAQLFREQRLAHQLPAPTEGMPLGSIPEVTGEALTTPQRLEALNASVAPNIVQNPALLAQLQGNPEMAANVVANIGVNFLPLLGAVFGVAAIIGITRWSFRKAFGK